jgi:hypothetical protein
LQELEGWAPEQGGDAYFWEGEFSMTKVFRRFGNDSASSDIDFLRDCRLLWMAECSLKVKIIAWLVRRGRIMTKRWRARWVLFVEG